MLCVVCVFEEGFMFSKYDRPGLPNMASGLLNMGFLLFCSVSVF